MTPLWFPNPVVPVTKPGHDSPAEGERNGLPGSLMAAGTGSTGSSKVVDDDPLVLEVTADLLKDLGCEVVMAASGSDALERLSENANIEILVTDLNRTATNLGGRHLARTTRDHALGAGDRWPWVARSSESRSWSRISSLTNGPPGRARHGCECLACPLRSRVGHRPTRAAPSDARWTILIVLTG